jgi:hypothetical protein
MSNPLPAFSSRCRANAKGRFFLCGYAIPHFRRAADDVWSQQCAVESEGIGVNRLLTIAIACLVWGAAPELVRGEDAFSGNIQDNSFLVEEAYNQGPGIVQHIFNWYPTWNHVGGNQQDFTFTYLMELPVGGQTHQFSFTPLSFEQFSDHPDVGPPNAQGGWSDTFLNYRYQLSTEDASGWRPAIAPRFSVILPTGNKDLGLGTGEVGYQFNLPLSKELDPFAYHFNAGLTYTPGVSVDLAGGGSSLDRNLHGYNLGGSVIWLATLDVNFMLELVSFWNEDLDAAGNRERKNSVILDPGIRTALFTGKEVQWCVGLGIPIGLSRDAPDVALFIYLSVEHTFLTKKSGD